MNSSTSVRDYADLALAVYVEELAAEKRVLFVGDADSPAPDRLGESALRVDVVSSQARARGTRRGGRVSQRRWPDAEDAQAWDLVIVPDLLEIGATDPERLREMSKWLAPNGVFVAGVDAEPGAEGADVRYETLYGLLESSFESVRMIGQAPFFGWSVVDFAPETEALDVTFDGSLLEGSGQKPRRYLAICGSREIVLDAYAVIQVPSTEVASAPPPSDGTEASERRVAELTQQVREHQDAIDAANVHAEALEQALDAAKRDLARANEDARRARERSGESQKKVDALRREVNEVAGGATDEEYTRLERALHERGREVGDLRAEVDRRGVLVRDLVEELRERQGSLVQATAIVVATPPPPRIVSDFTAPPPLAREFDRSATLELEMGPVARALQAQVAAAAERVVVLETDKADLRFRLDELRGELAIAEAKFEQDNEELRRLEATLRGTVRGLNARIGETLELYQLSQARCALAEDDRRAVERKHDALVREAAELREHLELEMSKVNALEMRAVDPHPAASSADDAAREQALRGELSRTKEMLDEKLLAETRTRGDLRAAALREQDLQGLIDDASATYERRIADLTHQLTNLGSDTERALIEASELKTQLEVVERGDAALRGELVGLRLRLEDREQAVRALTETSTIPPERRRSGRRADDRAEELAEATQARDHALAELASSREALEHLRARADEAEAKDREIAALSISLEAREAARAELERLSTQSSDEALRLGAALEAAELKVAAARVASADEARALEDLRAELSQTASARDATLADVNALRAEISQLETARNEALRDLEAKTQEADVARAASDLTQNSLSTLERAVTARESLVSRLQAELTRATELARAAEEKLHARDDAKVVAVVKSEEGERAIDALRAEIEEVRSLRDEDHRALEDARGILAQLTDDLDDEEGSGLPEVDGSGETSRLRGRLKELDREASDRDVLMRSLTAQLQERDDRIRALERMANGGSSAEPAELATRLFEMEERVARLTEELEHERARR